METVDTNVVVRVLMDDNAQQSAAVLAAYGQGTADFSDRAGLP